MRQTTLYFVRHGETEYNRLRIMQGRLIDSTLNATGRSQAEALARRLADVRFDVIISSALRRAIETADAVARRHGSVARKRLPDLDEMNWGILEGKPWSDRLAATIEDVNVQWAQGRYDYRIGRGESILDVQARAVRAVDHILDRHAGENVLVITHGRFLRVLLATVLDCGLERMDDFRHANTGVNILTHFDGRFEYSLLNCTEHLEALSAVLVD